MEQRRTGPPRVCKRRNKRGDKRVKSTRLVHSAFRPVRAQRASLSVRDRGVDSTPATRTHLDPRISALLESLGLTPLRSPSFGTAQSASFSHNPLHAHPTHGPHPVCHSGYAVAGAYTCGEVETFVAFTHRALSVASCRITHHTSHCDDPPPSHPPPTQRPWLRHVPPLDACTGPVEGLTCIVTGPTR